MLGWRRKVGERDEYRRYLREATDQKGL